MDKRDTLKRLNAKGAALRQHVTGWPWRRIGIFGGLGVVIILVLAQFFYPGDRMLPFSYIEGIDVSGQTKTEAIEKLRRAYADYPVAIYMAEDKTPVVSPSLSELNVVTNHAERVERVAYPWYLRVIPTSLFWVGVYGIESPKVAFGDNFLSYVDEKLMPNCRQQPVNATLKAEGGVLVAVPEVSGRSCEKDDVIASLKKIQPNLASKTEVRVRAKQLPADVIEKEAKSVAEVMNSRLVNGVRLSVNNENVTISVNDLLAWLDFAPHNDTVDVTVNKDRAGEWLNKSVANKVAIQPGTSYITTRDFTEISRQNGSSGRALDIAMTTASLQQVVNGKQKQAEAVTKAVPPKEEYTRTYSPSDQGLTALMAHYAKDHPGTYGVSMIELDGRKRRAEYSGDKQFVTASTYKLFVAYELLKQIDSGQRDWSSNADCFNKMISQSDNTCAESFLNSLGLSTVTKDIQAIGLKNSTFMKNGGPYTTANDQALLLGMIATGQNFSSSNQQRLISAMKANVYRRGIPAGVQGTVADKVGFLNGLLHDSAIIYGPNGTYVLSIMTDGSSWANIAELAKAIDELRAQ